MTALVNNAGLAVGKGPFDEGLDDDWDRMLDTNVKGLLFLARACVPFMTAGSRMVNMGSIAGKQVYPRRQCVLCVEACGGRPCPKRCALTWSTVGLG